MEQFENNQNKSSGKAHGGARKNAGRKEGSATKRTREIANQAVVEGLTPLEIMLKTMRALVDEADALEGGKGTEMNAHGIDRFALLMQAVHVAKAAAPYVHPRLATIEYIDKDDKNKPQTHGVLVVPSVMDVQEWERRATGRKLPVGA